jgi:hypothetical protein
MDGDAQKSLRITCPITTIHENWRPTLRGSTREIGTADFKVFQEVYADGLIESSSFITYGSRETYALPPEWVFCLFANALCSAEYYRQAAFSTNVEYGLELEVIVPGQSIPILPLGGYVRGRYLGKLPSGETLFPRYSIREPQQYQEITDLFVQDFWNAAGIDSSESVNIDYPLLSSNHSAV